MQIICLVVPLAGTVSPHSDGLGPLQAKCLSSSLAALAFLDQHWGLGESQTPLEVPTSRPHSRILDLVDDNALRWIYFLDPPSSLGLYSVFVSDPSISKLKMNTTSGQRASSHVVCTSRVVLGLILRASGVEPGVKDATCSDL